MTTDYEVMQLLAREADISLNGVSGGITLHPDTDISEDAAPVTPPFPDFPRCRCRLDRPVPRVQRYCRAYH